MRRIGELMMKKRSIIWGILLIWIAGIAIATRVPFFTGQSTANLLQTAYIDMSHYNFFVRKAVHFTVFGTLALTVWYALTSIKYQYAIAFLLSTMVGALDEWHQSFVADRTASATDVLINAAGASFF